MFVNGSFGSISWWLGRKADESSSYRWQVFVRGIDGEDLSHFISKVTFKLHDSFASSEGGVNRAIKSHPFEVEEGGWGEFTIGITIEFADSNEPPVHLQHYLKLDTSVEESSKKPVVSERYDEFVFNRPSPTFRAALEGGPTKAAPPHPLRQLFTEFDESDDIMRLQDAQNYISEELADMKSQVAALLEQSPAPQEYPHLITVGRDEIKTLVPDMHAGTSTSGSGSSTSGSRKAKAAAAASASGSTASGTSGTSTGKGSSSSSATSKANSSNTSHGGAVASKKATGKGRGKGASKR